jgi:uncharacterized membrane protein YhhN
VAPLAPALLVLAIVAALVDWVAVFKGGARWIRVERIAKPLVPALLALGVLAWPEASMAVPGVRPWIVIALVASLAGDVLLLPPGRLTGGLVAFLLAHLAYLAAFAQLPGSVPWLAVGLVAALVVAATVGRALVIAARGAGLAAPVAAYLVVICAMAVAATRTGNPAAIAGAWLFVTSDTLLGWGTFRGSGSRNGRVAVIVTYHLAQLVLVLALVASPA